MLTAVLVINLLISLLCFYIAWKAWQMKKVLDRVERTVTIMEKNTYNFLTRTPDFLAKGEKSSRQLRKQYRQLEAQIQQLQQILGLLTLGGRLWRRRSVRFR